MHWCSHIILNFDVFLLNAKTRIVGIMTETMQMHSTLICWYSTYKNIKYRFKFQIKRMQCMINRFIMLNRYCNFERFCLERCLINICSFVLFNPFATKLLLYTKQTSAKMPDRLSNMCSVFSPFTLGNIQLFSQSTAFLLCC